MSCARLLVYCTLISVFYRCYTQELTFPSWFKFGAATAAYQVEGGWNASDKGESTWDRLLHTHPDIVAGSANGDVACDSYHQWRRDIEMAVELGLDMYRFSISWPRLLPNGFANYISEDGKNYYNNLIDGLLEKGIEPLVTIYHFDLPQSLQDLGGWTNPLITDWFAEYASVVFSLYADRVKIWLTLNEPFGICDMGYSKLHSPYLDDMMIGRYLCNKYVMIAHAKAWRLYDEEYKPKYNGKVSLSTIFVWFEPATEEDKDITDLAIEHNEGRFSYPIFSKEGGWPPAIEKYLAETAKKEGYPYPRLIPFTSEEKELVRGTYDFYGLNHYVSLLVRKARPREKIGVWPYYGSEELGIILELHPTWEVGGLDWFGIYPEGLRKQLHWIKQTYGVQEILITENGYVSTDNRFEDWQRLKYTKDYLEKILIAIREGVNVTGYTHWTMMDNFEWLGGYRANFGLYAVNFTNPNRTRTPRESARYYASITRTRTINHPDTGLNYA